MIKKAWTPDNCPVQAGMCIHDTRSNTDIIVIRRYLNYDGDHDELKPLLETMFGILSGVELMGSNFTYYPEWPCTLDEKPCYREEEELPDIIELAQHVYEGLKESHYAVEGNHFTVDGDSYVWRDDIYDKISDVILELTKVFEEDKHEQ